MADKKRVLIGMSGGVDSSAAALILKDKGYEVCGCTIRMFDSSVAENSGALSDTKDARDVCDKLGIDHIVIDAREEFSRHVMQPFCDSYIDGETPNPCINCNKHIKFGLMLRKAEEMGFDYIATGHYADISFDDEKGRWLLKRPHDRKKDQTYVLYNMTQHQLSHTLFPLYGMDKESIRQLAEENGLITSRKRDSQDICFIPDRDYVSFIGRYNGYKPVKGDYIGPDGKKLGIHEGHIRYTIGQRKGLGVALGKPVFVISKDPARNTVTLSEQGKREKVLYLRDVNIISGDMFTEPVRVTAKARYSAKEQPATLYPMDENGRMHVEFDADTDNPTSGQSCVFYNDDIVLGGGIII